MVDYFFTALWSLRTILGSALLTVFHARCIQCTSNDVVTNTWKILHPATSDQYDRVLLQIVAFSWNVGIHFFSIRQPYPCYLPHRRVRLLGRSGVYPCTHSPSLRACIQCS